MDSIESQLEILKEDSQGKENYTSWRFKVDLTLKTKKLFNVATGVEGKPSGPDNSDAVIT